MKKTKKNRGGRPSKTLKGKQLAGFPGHRRPDSVKKQAIVPFVFELPRHRGEPLGEYRARQAITFIENSLHFTGGIYARQPFILDDWQREVVHDDPLTSNRAGAGASSFHPVSGSPNGLI